MGRGEDEEGGIEKQKEGKEASKKAKHFDSSSTGQAKQTIPEWELVPNYTLLVSSKQQTELNVYLFFASSISI